jgi:hypothetical protein
MKLRHSLIFVLIFVFVAGVAFAQGGKPLTINGQVFFEWYQKMNDEGDVSGSADKRNEFDFDRIWLILNKQIDDMWSFTLIVDFVQYGADPDTPDDGTSPMKPFVYECDVTATKDLGPVVAKVSLGKVWTPMIAYRSVMADQRFMKYSPTAGFAAYAYYYGAVDSVSDEGIAVDLNIMKMLTVYVTYTNGSGFMADGEDMTKDSSRGKSLAGRLQLGIPVGGLGTLLIAGFYSKTENSASADYYTGYYAAGVSFIGKFLRIGAYYMMPFWTGATGDDLPALDWTTGAPVDTERSYTLLDVYATLELGPLTGIPAFIAVQYGSGEDGNGDYTKSTFYGAGLGYHVGPAIRIALWYEQMDYEFVDELGGVNPSKKFAVKTEFKF